jgi:protein-S-isoprenylcysteine O-methyltransferase Ste14
MVRSLETKIPAPVVAATAGATMKFYARTWGVVIDPSTLRMYVGIAIAQVAGVIAIAAVAAMWRAHTTIDPFHPTRARNLVTGGIYRVTRNPMYLALLLLLVAYAVRIDSPVVWLAPVVFVAYVTRFQIQPEERVLEAKFGEDYLRYRSRTRRWV